MSAFFRDTLQPGVRPREVFAWAMFDFANSGYTTVVLTAVFNAYFVSVVTGGASWGTLAWTATLSLSYLIVMLAMPGLGAWADARGAKKRLLLGSTVGCVVGTVALAGVGPGDWWWAVIAIVVSNVCFSVGESLAAAFLPELARPAALGRVSGWGWSVGYLGGMLTLGLSLAVVLRAQAAGQEAQHYVPQTMWLTAAVFALAALPVFLLLKERARPVSAGTGRGMLRQLAASWRDTVNFPDFRRLLVCGVWYQAGIAVVITLAAVYAEQAMGFDAPQIMSLVFLVNIAATVGAFAFGYVQDRIGHRRALGITLIGWLAMVGIAYAVVTPAGFWVAAGLAGVCMGSSQSAGRAMTGALAPATRTAEFFALWTFATRLASILGPITYGLVTWVTAGNHRLAMLVTGTFFLLGLWVLRSIDIDRGVAHAATHS